MSWRDIYGKDAPIRTCAVCTNEVTAFKRYCSCKCEMQSWVESELLIPENWR